MSSDSWAQEVFAQALASGAIDTPRGADLSNFAIVPSDCPVSEALSRVTPRRPILAVVTAGDDIELFRTRRIEP